MLRRGTACCLRQSAQALRVSGTRAFAAAPDADVVVVGGGHNGLVSAAYLARSGLRVVVLEKRHLLGGCAVTEELIPGFKFSRASYLAGLLRPQLIQELQLPPHGFQYLARSPSSFTPTLLNGPHGGKSLMIGGEHTTASIAQFSSADAEAFPRYEEFLNACRDVVQPLLDGPPPDVTQGGWRERLGANQRMQRAALAALRHPAGTLPGLAELFTAPAAHILDRWFQSDVLKATLATDAVIGALTSPRLPGSGYVLLHHVMGEAAGQPGVWAYVRGGMGALSDSIARSARAAGAELRTDADVVEITVMDGAATGVRLADGSLIGAKSVLAACTPRRAFLELLNAPLPATFASHIAAADYSCGAFKINLALSSLPCFACLPNSPDGSPGPQHRGTSHFQASMAEIHDAYLDASTGVPARQPVVEMTLPSSLDDTLAPPGCHVASLFVQFAPYHLAAGSWADAAFKVAFVERVLDVVERHCPGFKRSIVAIDALSPLDLERVFGLHGGNIFHGALGLHQLAHNRPAPGFASHRTPVRGLYLAGAGAHPGGGVSGAPGRNCAAVVLSDLGRGTWWKP